MERNKSDRIKKASVNEAKNTSICKSIFEKTLQELTAKHRACFPENAYFPGCVTLDDTGRKTLW